VGRKKPQEDAWSWILRSNHRVLIMKWLNALNNAANLPQLARPSILTPRTCQSVLRRKRSQVHSKFATSKYA